MPKRDKCLLVIHAFLYLNTEFLLEEKKNLEKHLYHNRDLLINFSRSCTVLETRAVGEQQTGNELKSTGTEHRGNNYRKQGFLTD